MSEKAQRWKRYSYLGRLKQAQGTLQTLKNEAFLGEELQAEAHKLAIDILFFQRRVQRAIEEHKK
ncbi:MAG: hypothetical protein HC888_01630 [Candidatus Competibacteraceae bacterium]|nr:hypothetical protein [Candidatus Competibacteraceae bacterium]